MDACRHRFGTADLGSTRGALRAFGGAGRLAARIVARAGPDFQASSVRRVAEPPVGGGRPHLPAPLPGDRRREDTRGTGNVVRRRVPQAVPPDSWALTAASNNARKDR